MTDREDVVPYWLAAAVAVSGLAHFIGWLVVTSVPLSVIVRDITTIDFEVTPMEIETLAAAEEPEPPPPPPPEPEPVRRIVRTTPPPDAPPPPPAEETPVAFDNIVLTNEGGDASWATAQASGVDREGPIGPPGQATGRRTQGRPGGVVAGTGTAPSTAPVRPEDLSRRPAPPDDLNDLLRRFYPEEAERQGIEGMARLLLRVEPTGAAHVVRTVSSTRPEFATACGRMLRTTRWRPPLDRSGQPVATIIPFDCRFEVEW